MLFTIKLFLSSLFVVSNVFADQNDDAQACVELFNPDYVGQHCCESLDASETFAEDISSCLDSDEMTCDSVKCILNKHGVMKGDDIDEDSLKKVFEKAIKEHPKDKDVADRVLRECLNGKFAEYPPEDACPAIKFFTCVFVNVQLGCQKWKTTDVCNKMADNAKQCRALVDN